jgi:hypothetical protein
LGDEKRWPIWPMVDVVLAVDVNLH